MRALGDICYYVANNCYVNGIKLGNIMPELAIYMQDNYDPFAHDLVNMFGLGQLNLAEESLDDVVFDFTLHEDEITDLLNIRFDQWDDATAMMEAYETIFYNDLDNAWNQYVEDTAVTVVMEADLHREVIQDTVDYLWEGSAFPGASLDDVYPRPTVAFAAKNAKKPINNQSDYKQYYASAAAGTLAISGFVAFSVSKQYQKTQVETLL